MIVAIADTHTILSGERSRSRRVWEIAGEGRNREVFGCGGKI
jgi:hypothetical protein